MEEMERERKARESEEKEKAERMQKLKDQYADPSGQWEKDKSDIQKELFIETTNSQFSCYDAASEEI